VAGYLFSGVQPAQRAAFPSHWIATSEIFTNADRPEQEL
jgi:hypothetical protein